ncbi:MAG: hypothetical protein JHC19_02195 [Desulfurococcaceae archaeon]|nr:hypothetical protein [Desulfurococcaceae archaeon]
MKRYIDMIFAIIFPLIIFLIALSIYPIEAGEASVLNEIAGSQTNVSIEYPAYVSALIPVSGYKGVVKGEEVIKDVRLRFFDKKSFLEIYITIDDEEARIIIVNPNITSAEISKLIGAKTYFIGKMIKMRGKDYILTAEAMVYEKDTKSFIKIVSMREWFRKDLGDKIGHD